MTTANVLHFPLKLVIIPNMFFEVTFVQCRFFFPTAFIVEKKEQFIGKVKLVTLLRVGL